MFDIYIRVSRLGERSEDEATDVYEAQCLRAAERLGLEIDEIIDETNVSGSVEVADRELERLIQKIEAGESEGILVPFTDRFARDAIEGMLAYRRIALAGGRLVGAMDSLDSAAPGSKETFGYRMVTAEAFLDRVRTNYQGAIDRKVNARAHLYKVPLGYRKDEQGRLVVDEADAKLVVEVFERRAAGDDFGKLMRFLDEAGVVNAYSGKRYTKSGVRTMIKNRTYLGEIQVQENGQKGLPRTITGYHPPIVSSQLFETANAVRGAFHPRDASLSSQTNFRGMVWCAGCGRRLKVTGYTLADGRRVANYTCTYDDCAARAGMNAAKLDAYVDQVVTDAVLAHDPYVVAVIEGDTRHVDALEAVAEAQRLHDELRDDPNAQREMGLKDYMAALRVRKEAIAVARRQLAKVRPAKPQRKPDPNRVMSYEEFGAQDLREFNARLIEKIVVRPNPEGRSGAKVPASQRVDVYLTGAPEPYAMSARGVDYGEPVSAIANP